MGLGLGLGTTSLLSRASDRPLLGTTDDRESVSEPLEVTAVSRIHGTRRIHEVTGGHEEDPFRVQEEPSGHHRTREDTPLRRFGTVRPRVQIPGPRPFFELRISASDGSHAVAVAQGGHRFSWNSVAAAPSNWITDRRLNSLTALAQPIYQHAHGPRTVRYLGLKIKGAVHARVLPTHRPGPWATGFTSRAAVSSCSN